jgi:hypothetical protein
VADTVGLTYNGVAVTPTSAPLTGNMAGGTIVVGAGAPSGASPFEGREFCTLIRYPALTPAEEALVNPILADLTGVTL